MAAQRPFRPDHNCTATLAERRVRQPAGHRLDLSTRLNRYGPPEAVLRALRTLSPSDVQLRPEEAARRLESRHAEVLGVDESELVAGRGAAEFLVALGRQVPHRSVAVPLPASDDILAAFPGRGFSRYPGEQLPSLEQVDEALDAAEMVVIANPHDPTGILLDPAKLAEVAARHPASTLVVDESGVEFLAYPGSATVIGTEADNVIALRSSSEFYGIGAARAGVAWCRDRILLRRLFHASQSGSLSGLDAVATEAALLSTVWADAARRRLADDANWLAQALRPLEGQVVDQRVRAHYRCLFTGSADRLAADFATHGVGVAVLGPANGLFPGAVRVSAPRAGERALLFSAIEALSAASGWSVAG